MPDIHIHRSHTLGLPKARKVAHGRLADPERAGTHSPCVCVMEDDDLIVGSEPEVAFDARAHLERGCECDQAVFRKSRAIVKTAVGKAHAARTERISL